MVELHILQAFREFKARLIPIPYELGIIQYLKCLFIEIFIYILEEPLDATMWQSTTQGLMDKVPKKTFVLFIKSWIFILFEFSFLYKVPHNVIFGMIVWILH
jgi:hypothetical protein